MLTILNNEILKSNNYDINNDLKIAKMNLKTENNLPTLNEKFVKEAQSLTSDFKEDVLSKLKLYENDKKRYKALKKYHEVLLLVEKFLGIIPSNLDHLSIEELAESIENLIKTRNKITNQANFMLLQSLFSTSLQNLINIEKEYQTGKMSAKQANQKVEIIKNNIEENTADMPEILRPAKNEVSHLINMYQENYKFAENNALVESNLTLDEPHLSDKHVLQLNDLANSTKDLLNNINEISTNLSKFEPQVDLTNLLENLKDAKSVTEVENFDPENLNSAVLDLTSTTNQLEKEQLSKNADGEKLSINIQQLTQQTQDLSTTAIKETSVEAFKQAETRAETFVVSAGEIEKLIEDYDTPLDIGKQYANVIEAQLETDKDFCNIVENNPDAQIIVSAYSANDKALEAADHIKDKAIEIEFNNNLVLTVNVTNDEDENTEQDEENK